MSTVIKSRLSWRRIAMILGALGFTAVTVQAQRVPVRGTPIGLINPNTIGRFIVIPRHQIFPVKPPLNMLRPGTPSPSPPTNAQGAQGFSGIIGQNLYRQISGELRYTFQFSNLKLSGGGSEASFRGQTHTVQYNILWHARPARSRVRPVRPTGV